MDNSTSAHPLAGTTVSHYKILEKLGAGGMGEVYRAEDTRLKRTVALKFLPPSLTSDADARERLIHEAQAASALQHNNVCVVHDIDETPDGQMFLVMEFLEGEALNKRIERGPLKIAEAVDIAIQVAQGLSKAHEHGIIHRDIKPGNIIVTNDGVAKVVDFGLAKLSGRTMLTAAGTSLGTLAYMSPEQTRGEPADQRADIWALGVVLYEMTVGKMPFTGEYENVIVYEITNVDPPPPTSLRTGVPMDLERVINKAMAKSTDERYQHIDEMLVDLKRLAKSSEGSPQAARGPSAVSPIRRRRRKPVYLYAALLLILLSSFFILKPLLFDDILVSEPKPVAVVAFVNQTGDQAFDYLREAIPNLLITSLEQSKYLRVMTWERMNDLLKQMGRQDVKLIDKDLGFELCRREGVHAIVLGTFVRAGETFATDVKVLDVDTKELLKTASARGEGVQSILNYQIDQLSKEIARGVGLSKRKVEATSTQIAEVTTSSMDAYNYFLRGRTEFEKLYYLQSKGFFENAVALDSNFALAYFYLSRVYGPMLERSKAVEMLRKAMALAARAPEKERLVIEARYAELVERDERKHMVLLKELISKYPREKRFHNDLGVDYQSAGMLLEAEQQFEKAIALDPNYALPVNGLAYLYRDQGLYERAIETLQRYAALSPGDANPFDSMGEIFLCMGNLDGAVAKYREAIRLQPSFFEAYKSLAYVYALKEDYGAALACCDDLLHSALPLGVRVQAMNWKMSHLIAVGRNLEAFRLLEEIGKLVPQLGNGPLDAPYHWVKALFEVQRKDFRAARKEFLLFCDAYDENNPRTPISNAILRDLTFAGLSLRQRNSDSARTYIDRGHSRLPQAENLKETLLMISGITESEILLVEGRADSSIRVYRKTPVPRPSMAQGWRLPLYNVPNPRDVVPRAFESMGKLDSAIVEYERLLKIDPASKDRRLINPLYHYRLASLYQRTGRWDRAAAEYSRFLKIWEKADSDLPEPGNARRQLVLLTRK